MNCDRCDRPASGSYNGHPRCGACLTGTPVVPPYTEDIVPTPPVRDGRHAVVPRDARNTVDLLDIFPRLTEENIRQWAAQDETDRQERARLIRETEARQEQDRRELADRIQRGQRF